MNVILLFSYNVSLKNWYDLGILSRELLIYKILKKQKDIHYSLITYGDDSDLNLKNDLGGISIIPIKNLIKSRIKYLALIKSFFLPIKLYKLFKNSHIIKSNQIVGSWVAILAKILYRKKIIVRAGYEWLRNYKGLAKLQKQENKLRYFLNLIYIYIIEFIIYKFADKIIFSNQSDQDFAIDTFKLNKKRKNIGIIPNYIDTNLFKPIDVKKKENYVLFIGRLSKEKNLDNLLMAFKDLKDFKLDIIGTGPLEHELKSKVSRYNLPVNFLGVFPNNELPYIINQYNIFILPSFYEANPKSLLEAMSCGLTCIGTNVRGIREIIINGKNGLLCDLNPFSIKNAILSIKELQIKIGVNARKYILNNCSIKNLVKKEHNIYQDLIKL
ncbi:MAG: glycosyltransferase family 4 protein [Promethearchaeota archaeon]